MTLPKFEQHPMTEEQLEEASVWANAAIARNEKQ